MNDSLVVHIFKAKDHAGDHEFGFFFVEAPSLTNMVPQITASKEITDKKQSFPVLEGIVDVY